MRKRTAWVLAAGIAALALGAAAVGAVALVLRGGGRSSLSASGGQYLSLDLAGELPEQQATGLAGLFSSRPPSLRTVIEAIDSAAGDVKVRGLLLRVGTLDVGWARAAELRDALVRFRRSGKPSWAHLEAAGNREYFVATGCQKIAAAPTATLDISGLAAEVTFFKGSLDKLGVEAQFEGVGKYKNAPNQFTEKGFTAPHREQMESLVGSLFDSYVSAVAEGRGMPAERVRALVDEGPFEAAQAKAAGLVDALLYRDEVEAHVGAAQGVGPGRYVRALRGFGLDSRPQIALVYVVGTITSGESQDGGITSAAAGADTIVQGLREAAESDRVRAVVMRVDSPGGSGTASDAVWREVARVRVRKPVIVSMGDYAASGGYYVAMGADAIVAEAGTITGSIGVFREVQHERALREARDLGGRRAARPPRAAVLELRAMERGGARARARHQSRLLRDLRGEGGPGSAQDGSRDRCGGTGAGLDGARGGSGGPRGPLGRLRHGGARRAGEGGPRDRAGSPGRGVPGA